MEEQARQVLQAAWHPAGYTAPNPERYPWQWLWDSCFHAIAWTALGDDRGVTEVARLLSAIDSEGFLPHVLYAPAVSPHAEFWGRPDTSSITQPPMHGHALAELRARGLEVPDRLFELSSRALRFLLERRHRVGGLVQLCHPWESGADDSPRWDHWYGSPWVATDVHRIKGELLAGIERGLHGAAVANDRFVVASASFNALVVFNALEVVAVTGDELLAEKAEELRDALDEQWDADLETWVDVGESAAGSGRVRTVDALLGALVTADPARAATALAAAVDPAAYGGEYGPAGVHRAEATFDPSSYWRGSSWPQLNYLLWVAARRRGLDDHAEALAAGMQAGVAASAFAEHWDPDTGAGLGAVPQSWATLVVTMR